MQKYRFILRHDHADFDVLLATGHIGVLKAELKETDPQAVYTKRTEPFPPNGRDGEILINVMTVEEAAAHPDYEKA